MRIIVIAVVAAIAGASVVLIGALAASGGSGSSGASEEALRRKADLWEIDQLEKKFHKATSTRNVELMMSLYAPDATFTFPGTIAAGRKQIRDFWVTSKSFTSDWVSETPPFNVRITVNGNRGTLYFECVYIDRKTEKVAAVTAADGDVTKINGRWLITSLAGASATLDS